MTVLIPIVDTTTDTFGQWVSKTNRLAAAMSNVAITVNSNTAVGNASIQGQFTANSYVATELVSINLGSSNIVSNGVGILFSTATSNNLITAQGMLINSTTSYTYTQMRVGATRAMDGNVSTTDVYVTNSLSLGNTYLTTTTAFADSANVKYLSASHNGTIGDNEANVYADRYGLQIFANPTGTAVVNSKMTSTDLWIQSIHANTVIFNTMLASGPYVGNLDVIGSFSVTQNSTFHGNNYFDYGLTSNGNIIVDANTPGANAYLYLKADRYAGIFIQGDRNATAGKPGGAFVAFYEDGGSPEANTHFGLVGIVQSSNDDLYGDNQAITDSLFGYTVVGSKTGGTHIVAGNKAIMTVKHTNSYDRVGFGTNDPQNFLDLNPGEIRFRGSSTGYTVVKAAAAAGGLTLTLPTKAPAAGQFIASDTSGNLSFADAFKPDLGLDFYCRSLGVGTAAPGVSGIGQIRATNNITSYYSSDRKLKENVRPIENALDKLLAINGVRFDWTDEYIEQHGGEDGYFVRKQDIGVIAQEVEAILPEVVAENDEGTKAVRYEKLVALLIEAVKELKQEVEDLKNVNKN